MLYNTVKQNILIIIQLLSYEKIKYESTILSFMTERQSFLDILKKIIEISWPFAQNNIILELIFWNKIFCKLTIYAEIVFL